MRTSPKSSATVSSNPTEVAYGELTPSVYKELRRLAASQMARESPGQTIQATELVHEAWLRYSGDESWKDTNHFLTAAARTMRRILIDRARRKAATKHGGDLARIELDEQTLSSKIPDEELLIVNEAIERFEKIDPVRANVVILKFFGDLTNLEIARALNVTERSVERYWAHAKVWLFREIQQRR